MTDTNIFKLARPGTFPSSLTEISRSGARALLTQAVEAEVAGISILRPRPVTGAWCATGICEIMTGTGPVAVRQPRVRDRDQDRSDLKGRDQLDAYYDIPPHMRAI